MKQVITIFSIIILLSACQEASEQMSGQMSQEEQAAIESLSWLAEADPERDAKTSLKRGDKRLFALANRGTSIPGVPVEAASKAKSVCGIRYLDGSTDAVQGETHLQLLQAARQYAYAYNAIIYQQCLPLDQ